MKTASHVQKITIGQKKEITLWVLLNQYKYVQHLISTCVFACWEGEIIVGPTATCSLLTRDFWINTNNFLVQFLYFRGKSYIYLKVKIWYFMSKASTDNWCEVMFLFYLRIVSCFSNCCELKVLFEKWMISAGETPI